RRQAAYFCQQSAEKIARAILTHEGVLFGTGHNLGQMAAALPSDREPRLETGWYDAPVRKVVGFMLAVVLALCGSGSCGSGVGGAGGGGGGQRGGGGVGGGVCASNGYGCTCAMGPWKQSCKDLSGQVCGGDLEEALV